MALARCLGLDEGEEVVGAGVRTICGILRSRVLRGAAGSLRDSI